MIVLAESGGIFWIHFTIILLIVLFTYLLPFMTNVGSSEKATTRKNLLLCYFFIITLHHIFAYIYSHTSLILEPDSISFTANAMAQKEFFIRLPEVILFPSRLYELYLSVFFNIFGASQYFANELSVLSFSFTIIVFMKLHDEMGLKSNKVIALLMFSIIPSVMFETSISMRESYQLLGFLLVVYFYMRGLHYRNLKDHFYFLLSLMFLGLLHEGLFIFTWVVLSIYIVNINLSNMTMKSIIIFLFIVTFFLLIIYFLADLRLPGIVRSILSGDAIDFALSQREERIYRNYGRTTYDANLEISSVIAFVLSIFNIFIRYMFLPFPWKISNILDMVVVFENALRLILFCCVCYGFYFEPDKNARKNLRIIFLLYLILEFMWAMGVTNYGTGLRHHVMSWGVLMLIGLPYLSQSIGLFKIRQKPKHLAMTEL